MKTILLRRASRLGLVVSVLILTCVVAAPLKAAPAATHGSSRDVAFVIAHLFVSPASASPGSTVTVTGTNWAPGEVVSLSFDLQPLVNVAAGPDGTLPATPIAVPLGTTPSMHHIVAFGQTSKRFAIAALTVNPLQPVVEINHQPQSAQPAFDPGRRMCVDGHGFGPGDTVLLSVDGNYMASGPVDAAGIFDLCFDVPQNIVTGANLLTVVGSQTHTSVTLTFQGLLPPVDTQYLVGGSTVSGDVTSLPLLNAGPLTTTLTLTFYTHRLQPVTGTVVMPPHSNGVVQARQFVPAGETFGVRVQADKTVTTAMIVRRADKAPYSLTGTRQLATTTYLPGGITSGTFHEILYLLNPQPAAVTARIRVVPVGTAKARTLSVTVPANGTAAYELNRLYPGQSISAVVESGSPLAVSRVLTFGPHLYGANAAAGLVQPQKQWVFPTASVAAGARTALAVYNPSNSKKATLTLTMYDESGARLFVHTERVPAKQHLDIDLNNTLLGTAVMTRTAGFQVTASSSVPLFIEQSFYAGPPDTARVASSFLSSPPVAGSWSFAGGDTTDGISETLTIVNPGKTLASVHVTFIRANGTTVPLNLALLAGTRTSVDVASQIPSLGPSVHGIQVTSRGYSPIAVEQGESGPAGAAGYSLFGATP